MIKFSVNIQTYLKLMRRDIDSFDFEAIKSICETHDCGVTLEAFAVPVKAEIDGVEMQGNLKVFADLDTDHVIDFYVGDWTPCE